MTVTNNDINLIVAEKFGMLLEDSKQLVDTIVDVICQELVAGNRIELRGFGVFAVRQRLAKKGRNIRTGEEVIVPERKVPVFRAGRVLKGLINHNP